MRKYLHVGFDFKGSSYEVEKLKALFDQAEDWLKYSPNCWILYTSESPEVWRDRLKKVLSAEDQFLVLEVKWNNFAGWMNEMPRNWIERERQP